MYQFSEQLDNAIRTHATFPKRSIGGARNFFQRSRNRTRSWFSRAASAPRSMSLKQC